MTPWARDPRHALLALATSGTAIALSLSGEVSPLGLVVPAIAAWSAWRPRVAPRSRAFEWSFQIISAAFLLWFVASALRGQVLAGAAVLTFPAQVYALLQPPSLLSLKRLQTLGFFQLVALAASTTAIFFGPLLLLHLVLAPALFTLAHLEAAEGEPRRPARLPRPLVRACLATAGAVLAIGAVIFLLLPRYEVGLLSQLRRPGQRISGFSETVSLGDITSIQGNDEIVMRVRLRGEAPKDLRWRGLALDEFSGREWRNTAPQARPTLRGEIYQIREATPGAPRVTQEITVEPTNVRALFHLPGLTRLRAESFRGVRVDQWGNLQRLGEARRTRYEAISEAGSDARPLTESERASFLQLPDLDPRVEAAAIEAAGEGDDLARARRILQWIQSRCEYGLDVNDTGAADPVAWFLFEQRRGHCEYFATAMAVLLREAGIPSRIVNGFQSGERSELFAAWIIRQRDAHSWVEAWIPGRGWTTFDPTPPAGRPAARSADAFEMWRQLQILWDDNVIGFNYTFQLGFLVRVREALDAVSLWARRSSGELLTAASGLAACALGLAVIVVLRRRRRAGPARRVAFHERATRLLARRGFRRKPSQTPWELARHVAERDPERGAAALELARLYYAVRYGGIEADRARVDELLRRLA